MNIDLIQRITGKVIISFECNDDEIKIINVCNYCAIKMQINKAQYDALYSQNYDASWNQAPIHRNVDTSNQELSEISLKIRKYYISVSISEMDDEMLDGFYNDILFGYNYIEKEYKKIDYKESCVKTNNLDLYINNKLVDVKNTIFNENLIYV